MTPAICHKIDPEQLRRVDHVVWLRQDGTLTLSAGTEQIRFLDGRDDKIEFESEKDSLFFLLFDLLHAATGLPFYEGETTYHMKIWHRQDVIQSESAAS